MPFLYIEPPFPCLASSFLCVAVPVLYIAMPFLCVAQPFTSFKKHNRYGGHKKIRRQASNSLAELASLGLTAPKGCYVYSCKLETMHSYSSSFFCSLINTSVKSFACVCVLFPFIEPSNHSLFFRLCKSLVWVCPSMSVCKWKFNVRKCNYTKIKWNQWPYTYLTFSDISCQ